MSPGPAVARVEPDTAVIQGKLGIPAPARELVDRPRLDRLLADLIERHHTVVVSATAGSGKTTAVAHALEHSERPVAWLTVDAPDSAPGRLLTYLEAALADPLPQVGGTVSSALAAGIPHAEVAGLLAEAVADEPVALVLDELERLSDDCDAWPVIEALLRYAPPELHAVLISRRVVPAFLWGRGPWKSEVALVSDADLAFNTAEASAALRMHADTDVDAQVAVDATGGWVTGVLFEAWRAAGHVRGSGGEADPLHGYLSTHILNQLPPAERDFLVATSLLVEVTPTRAAALGQAEPAERMRALRRCHLPINWAPRGLVMRCHSRFREYLLDRLDEKDPDERRALRLAYAGLMADNGYVEDATEEFLALEAFDEALEPAERAIVPIIERLDFPVAERWLEALEPVADHHGSQLAKAELMLALAQNNLRRGNAIADRLTEAGRRDELVRRSATLGGLLGWCYLHAGRVEEARGLVELMEPGVERDALLYGLGLWGWEPPIPRPQLTGGPIDGLILIADYHYGRLTELVGEGASGWMDVMAHPPRIGALRALGRTQEALDLYETARAHGVGTQRLEVSFGIEVLLDAGLLQQADEALARRRAHAAQAGSLPYQIQIPQLEAKLALRGRHDPAAALAALDELERRPYARDFPFLTEHLDTWYGLALLMRSEDDAALERLRPTVDSMLEADRLLELPSAAVFLSEAEWRAGNDDAADACADIALDAARRMGSNHVLLQALQDFPGVVSRRIDSEPGADSPWHDLGRALIAKGAEVDARPQALVTLREFGRCAIIVGGEEVRPRIRKTYELLAYLSTRRGATATRTELLDALFDGRDDDSTRAYLRQAVRWLRQALPEEAGIESEGGEVRLTGGVLVTSESTVFEAELAAAASMRDEARLSAIQNALAIYDQGDYLPGARTIWVDGRMRQLAQLAGDARYEAAELAYTAHRYDLSTQLADQVLELEPYRETAWRLKMRIAAALGDDDGVIRAYHGAELALADVGTGPSPTTRDLLERLRR